MKLQRVLLLVGLLAVASLLAIGCSEATSGSEGSPEDVVDDYYTWYLGNLGYDPDTGEFRNPLQDGSYQLLGLVSDEFVNHIEQLRTEGLRADPFLCAQDVPAGFEIREVEADPDAGQAQVLVGTSFPGHQFQVQLLQVGGEWKISNVFCGP